MNVQLIAAVTLVGLAAAYLGLRTLRAWGGKGGCGGGCSCGPKAASPAAATFIPVERLTLRVRAGGD